MKSILILNKKTNEYEPTTMMDLKLGDEIMIKDKNEEDSYFKVVLEDEHLTGGEEMLRLEPMEVMC